MAAELDLGAGRTASPMLGALDLGTNNCRLLIAEAAGRGFRVVDSFSQIVRLGEGLTQTGRLSERAMERTLAALTVCAEKLRAARVERLRCVATEACRRADNGAAFLRRVRSEVGLSLEVISPEEESRLAVASCRDLADPDAAMALVVDVGGGSTELSWFAPGGGKIMAWVSAPVGVVGLAEAGAALTDRAAFESCVGDIEAALRALQGAPPALRDIFRTGAGQVIGASGAVTCLAGVHLNLPRYQRARVDGLWMSVAQVRATIARLIGMSLPERAAHPCIGPLRADLVAPGAAILEAVLRVWPAPQLRVADRGLREGILMDLLAQSTAGDVKP